MPNAANAPAGLFFFSGLVCTVVELALCLQFASLSSLSLSQNK